MNPTYNFTGQVALVTGARVVLSSDDATRLAAATAALAVRGHDVCGIVCDVADEDQVTSLVAQTVAVYGRLNMAFNNAGIQGPHEPFTATTGAPYDAVSGINLRGVWACMKHELLQMEKQGAGVEYVARGIRVHAVCPGVFGTPMLSGMKDAHPEVMDAIVDAQPIGAGLVVDGVFTAQ